MTTADRGVCQLSVNDLSELSSFCMATLSPSRRYVAFYADGTGSYQLYVLHLTSGKVQQVTESALVPPTVRTRLAWSRDDRQLIFARDVDGDERFDLYRLDIETRNLRALTADRASQDYPVEFAPGGDVLSIESDRRHGHRCAGSGTLNLWRLDSEGTLQPLTCFASGAMGGRWSPDGQWVAVTANEDVGEPANRDGYLVKATGSECHRVLRIARTSQDTPVAWHPEHRHLAFTSDASGVPQAGVLDLSTAEIRWVGSGTFEEQAICFSPDGNRLLCLRTHEASVTPVLYSLSTGTGTEIRLPSGVAWNAIDRLAGSQVAAFIDDRTVLVTHTTGVRRPELLACDVSRGRRRVILPADDGGIDADRLTNPEHLYYPARDGTNIPALIYSPPGRTNEARPAVIMLHGGPDWQWFRSFDGVAQILASHGIVVFQPNVRGSTGYGAAFRDAIHGDLGGVDLRDVEDAVLYLRSFAGVDAGRIAIFGASYGGYLAYMAAFTFGHLLKSACAWAAPTDWRLAHDEAPGIYAYVIRQYLGDPQTNARFWRERSPLHVAPGLRTRLLVLHGVNDIRGTVEHARRLRRRLEAVGFREGRDFEYVELVDEGHGSNDRRQRFRAQRLVTEFFLRTLLPSGTAGASGGDIDAVSKAARKAEVPG
jgi:dipeptidyl aminopeptidase/acylaminoacyl peptidase